MMSYSFMKLKAKDVSCIALLFILITCISSCDNFIDVVPEGTATVDKVFRTRQGAKQFLYTLYSYLPLYARSSPAYSSGPLNPAFSSTQEIIFPLGRGDRITGTKMLKGLQDAVNPYFNYWEGRNGGSHLYEAIRKCNVFINNVKAIGQISEHERKRWIAEAKFLKAYYYFWLVRMYGPVVLYKHNISVDAPDSKIAVPRASLDESFNYILNLLDEVINNPYLPSRIQKRIKNLGRITKSVAYAMKAKVAVTAASPLFNGAEVFSQFTNVKGNNPFNTEYEPAKWDSAVVAAQEAIAFVQRQGFHMYEFKTTIKTSGIDDTTRQKMTLRNSFALGQGKINPGAIWVRAGTSNHFYRNRYNPQTFCLIRGLNPDNPGNAIAMGWYAPSLAIAEMFYTNHGLPIKKDKTWAYENRYEVAAVGHDQRFNLIEGYKTAKLNMHRGPRFYAYMAFDGNIYYGSGRYKGGPDNYHHIKAKKGQINWYATHENGYYSITGYWIKKLVNYKTRITDNGAYGHVFKLYNWPIMRLADLYLLYAEAKNEADGPGPLVYKYLNKVRKHAGLPTVQKTWSTWSTNPDQYKTKAGLREIIHHERLIELAFEGQRFWDLRRWMAIEKLNQPVRGWTRSGATAEEYYQPRIIPGYESRFTPRDYFWPISEKELSANSNLSQNPGW